VWWLGGVSGSLEQRYIVLTVLVRPGVNGKMSTGVGSSLHTRGAANVSKAFDFLRQGVNSLVEDVGTDHEVGSVGGHVVLSQELVQRRGVWSRSIIK
jgi:hypothetical protein